MKQRKWKWIAAAVPLLGLVSGLILSVYKSDTFAWILVVVVTSCLWGLFAYFAQSHAWYLVEDEIKQLKKVKVTIERYWRYVIILKYLQTR